jgi:DNA-binding GntR family transcriptional regulator
MTVRDLAPIEKRSAEAQALARLREAIVAGRLGPGARLTEVALAEQLRTSRATLRTALHHLVAEGLVVQVPYTGWMVATLSAQDAWELVTLRASLEGLAAGLAAEAREPDGLAAVDAAFKELSRAARAHEATAATEADFAFHQAIVLAAGHQRLAEHYRRVAQQVRLIILSSNALLSDPLLLLAQHEPIHAAIAGRKPKAAAKAARAHVEHEGEALIAALRAKETAA